MPQHEQSSGHKSIMDVLMGVQNQVATHLKCVFGKAGSFLTPLSLPKRVKGEGGG